MEENIERLTKRSIAILIMIIPIAWFLSTFTMSLITQTPWPPTPPISLGVLTGLILMIGFMIYGVNLRDERTSQISDKATRNGFAFVLFVTPSALVVLSLIGAPIETAIVLLVVCLGMVAVASISALYYYHR